MQNMPSPEQVSVDIVTALRRALLRLAKAEEDRAADQAAKVPYWSPCPVTVEAHRFAAEVLRAEADTLVA
jgi:hypothetical protein